MTSWFGADSSPIELDHTNVLAWNPVLRPARASRPARRRRRLGRSWSASAACCTFSIAPASRRDVLRSDGRQLARAGRQLVDDRQRLALKRVGESAAADTTTQSINAAPMARGTHIFCSQSTAGSSA